MTAADLAQASATTRAVQRELESRGYYGIGSADGVLGLATRAAVMAYEYDHGLPLTADPTEDLLRTIILGTASSDQPTAVTLRPTSNAEQVIRIIQRSLVGLGLGPIKPDGLQGETTIRAIRRFEQQQGLPETGRISGVLVARLAKLTSLGQVQVGQ